MFSGEILHKFFRCPFLFLVLALLPSPPYGCQGLANYGPLEKPNSSHTFINKFLLTHSHAHHLCSAHSCFRASYSYRIEYLQQNPYGPQSLNYLLFGPWQQKIADPWSVSLIYTNDSVALWELAGLWTNVIYKSQRHYIRQICGFYVLKENWMVTRTTSVTVLSLLWYCDRGKIRIHDTCI